MAKKIGNKIGLIGGAILAAATVVSAVVYGVKKIMK